MNATDADSLGAIIRIIVPVANMTSTLAGMPKADPCVF
jgi:hypothetical protein